MRFLRKSAIAVGVAALLALAAVLGFGIYSSDDGAPEISNGLKAQGFQIVEITNIEESKADVTVRVKSCNFMVTALKDGEQWNAYQVGDRSLPPVNNDELTDQLEKQARHEWVKVIMFPLACDEPV